MAMEGESVVLGTMAEQLREMNRSLKDIKRWQDRHEAMHQSAADRGEERRVAMAEDLAQIRTKLELPGNPIEQEKRLGTLEASIGQLRLWVRLAGGVAVSCAAWLISQAAGHVSHLLSVAQTSGSKAPGS